MITVTFNLTDKRVIAAIEAKQPRVKEQLSRTLDSLMLQLQQSVQRKLSGEVLQTHTGKGVSSVIKPPIEDSGTKLSGKVQAGGGPAFYLRIQEIGGTRSYQILPRYKKALAFFPQGSLGGGGGIAQVQKSIVNNLYFKSGARAGTLKPGKVGKFSELGGVVVRGVQHPPLKARYFMRNSLEEMRETIVDRLRTSMAEALRS